eukprot:COSAG01_NODE_10190_length_2225_cov_138.809031_1_plen_392_part_00
MTPSPRTSCGPGANIALLVLLRPRTPPSRSPLRIPHYSYGPFAPGGRPCASSRRRAFIAPARENKIFNSAASTALRTTGSAGLLFSTERCAQYMRAASRDIPRTPFSLPPARGNLFAGRTRTCRRSAPAHGQRHICGQHGIVYYAARRAFLQAQRTMSVSRTAGHPCTLFFLLHLRQPLRVLAGRTCTLQQLATATFSLGSGFSCTRTFSSEEQRRDHSAWHRLRHIFSFVAAFAAISLLAAPARCSSQPPAHKQQLSRAPTSPAPGPSRRRSCILWQATAHKHDRTSDRQEADDVRRSCSASSPGGAYPPAFQTPAQTSTTGLVTGIEADSVRRSCRATPPGGADQPASTTPRRISTTGLVTGIESDSVRRSCSVASPGRAHPPASQTSA